MRMTRFGSALLLGAFALAACGGGGGGSSAVPAASHAAPVQSAPASVAMTLVIPSAAKAAATHKRVPRYISAGTQGLTIVTKQGSTVLGTTTIGTTVASNPSGCQAVSGGTSCSFSLVAAAPSTDFYLTAYDQPPSGGTIPAGAHVLATFQQLGIPIVARQVNALAFTMGGVVASLALGNDPVVSAAAQGAPFQTAVAVIPKDASGEVILTAAGDSTLDQPISVALSEPNGAGHSFLSTDNGATHASSPVSIVNGSTTVTLVYDGGGTAPDPANPQNAYEATVTVSVPSSSDDTTGASLGNAASASFDLAPVFVVGANLNSASNPANPNGATFTPGSPPSFGFTNVPASSGLTQGTVDLVAARAATKATYASGLTSASCTDVTFAQSGSAPAAGNPVALAFTPVLGANPTTSPCSFAASDGAGASLALSTTYTPTSGNGSVVIPGGTPVKHVYVANTGGRSITVYPLVTSGSYTSAPLETIAGGSTNLQQASGLALDAAGRIYVADPAHSAVYVYPAFSPGTYSGPPLETIAGGSTGLSFPFGVSVDAVGRIYVTNAAGGFVTIFPPYSPGTYSGAPVATIHGGLASSLLSTLDSAGNLFVVDNYYKRVEQFPAGITGAYTAGPTSTVSVGTNPYGAGFDPSGRMYVADEGTNTVTIFPAGIANNGNYGGSSVGTIGGGSTGLDLPTGVAIDPTGVTYVTNYYGNDVSVFPAGITGNYSAAPLATIGGGAAGIQNPTGIVVF